MGLKANVISDMQQEPSVHPEDYSIKTKGKKIIIIRAPVTSIYLIYEISKKTDGCDEKYMR